MFKNPEKVIRRLAKFLFVLGVIASVLIAIVCFNGSDAMLFAGFIILPVGPIISYICTNVILIFVNISTNIEAIRKEIENDEQK